MSANTGVLTLDQARSLYRLGEDAVAELLVELSGRVNALEQRLSLNSGNSSKPPSSDGLKKPALKPMNTQSLRKKTGKKPGGQQGHPGSTLQPAEKPDVTVEHRPDTCEHCHGKLENSLVVGMSRRQVFDIPQPKVVVTEHQMMTVRCECCGKETQATAPAGADKSVQYGPNILGVATYLHVAHLLPCKRTAEIIRNLTGASFSPGTLARAVRAADASLLSFDQRLTAALATVPVKHVDETGVRVSGALHWFHTRSTKALCRVFHHVKRGGAAIADLLGYTGTLVSDFFAGYVSLPCTHVFCCAHVLRELRFVDEAVGQYWAPMLFATLDRINDACHRARERGLRKVPGFRQMVRDFDHWVKKGLEANSQSSKDPSLNKARCLATRLSERRDDYLRFLHDLSLPFTNNLAERDVRMSKVKQKISGCFRTDAGADTFCRIRSYTATCQRQGMNLLECLRSVFAGQTLLPSLEPA